MRERLEFHQQFLQTLYASSREDLQQAIADAALQPPRCAPQAHSRGHRQALSLNARAIPIQQQGPRTTSSDSLPPH